MEEVRDLDASMGLVARRGVGLRARQGVPEPPEEEEEEEEGQHEEEEEEDEGREEEDVAQEDLDLRAFRSFSFFELPT